MMRDRVRWSVEDKVARLTLARPEAGNALDMAMAAALQDAADRVVKGAADGTVRVAVLEAEGPTFCVGGDLREFAGAEDRGQKVKEVADALHRAILALRACRVPVVSVVHGTAAGGGIGMALAADIVLAASEAKLRLAYTAGGLTPDCGATWVLTQRLGPARALDLALTNRVVTGAEAAAWGLVSRAVPAAELPAESARVAEALRSGPAGAFAEAKRLVGAAQGRSLAEQLRDERDTIGRQIGTPEAYEGIAAFFEKRTPEFD
ncbi:enoyl-CoA hydratase/isomerase family protein [Streptomyces sp. NPDC051677]|uniref:enoyl-CoA hydratase/isomerase family protein n=1 Tax=Streptomyces sp. NPDC051677 TaxID=3365669 RepID=UPI0037D48850